MTLQTKLVGAFLLGALVTLFFGSMGYYNVKKLDAVLYEIGAVRLPSIQGQVKTLLDIDRVAASDTVRAMAQTI